MGTNHVGIKKNFWNHAYVIKKKTCTPQSGEEKGVRGREWGEDQIKDETISVSFFSAISAVHDRTNFETIDLF